MGSYDPQFDKEETKTSMGNIPWSKFLAAKKKTKQKKVLYIPFRKWKKSNNLGLELFGPPLISEKAMTPHSSTLAWKSPWTEEPGGLQFMGSLRVGHDWATSLSLSCIGEGNGNPLQWSCLENPRDGGAWWAAVYGVAQSWTRLKRLSSSSSMLFYTYVSNV